MTRRPASSSFAACALALSSSPAPYRAVSWAPALTVGLTTTSGQWPASRPRRASQGGRHNRHAGRGEVPQVGLVGVPGDHVGRVGQPGHAVRPGREVVPAWHVVPGGPDHHQVVRAPVDGGVVPDPPVGVQPGRGAGGTAAARPRPRPVAAGRSPAPPGEWRGWAGAVAALRPSPLRARSTGRAAGAPRDAHSPSPASAHQRVDGDGDEQQRQVGVGPVEEPHRLRHRRPPGPRSAERTRPSSRCASTRNHAPAATATAAVDPAGGATGHSSSEVATITQL